MQSSMIKSITEDFGNGGTIDGDLTISGDLQVSGGGSLSFDEIIQGTQVIDVTNTEALLVRKNDDGGDVFVVDTTNSRVGIGTASPTMSLEISNTSFGDQLRLHRSSVASGGFLTLSANDSAGNIHDYAKLGTVVESSTNGSEDGALVFQTSLNGTLTEYLRITSAGKVGIGTDSPNEGKLVVQDSTKAELVIKTSATATDTESALMFKISTDTIDQRKKGGIIYKDVGDNGIGDMFFVLDSATDNGSATVTDNTVMTLKNNGNVGIGTSSPASALVVQTTNALGIDSAPTGSVSIGSPSGTLQGAVAGRQTANTTALHLMASATDANTSGDIVFNTRENNNSTFATTSNAGFKFQHYTTDLVTILRNGKVGIGTSSVNGIFTAQGTPMTAISAQTVADIFGNVQQDADKGGGIGLGGRYITNSSSVTAFAEISGVKANNTSANYEGEMVFKTRVNGGNLTERIRIDGSGNVGIGTDNPDTKLDIVGSDFAGASLKIERTGDGENDDSAIRFNRTGTVDANDRIGGIYFQDNDTSLAVIRGEKIGTNDGRLDFIVPNGSAFGNTMNPVLTIQNDSVGIGTSSPAHTFHVHATSTTDNQPAVWLHNNHNASNKDGTVISATNDGSDAEVLHVRTNNTTYNNGTSLMLVRGDGNVGIGTDSPAFDLEIADSGTNSQATMAITGYNDQTGYRPEIQLRKSNSDTLGSVSATPTGTQLGMIRFRGVDSGNGFDDGAVITATQNGGASTKVPTDLKFETSADTSTNSNQLVLHHDGGIGIGVAEPTHNLNVYSGSGSSSMTVGKYASGKTVALLGTSADTSGYFQIQSYASQGSTFGNIALNSQGGNVGIGRSTNIDKKLHILSSTSGDGMTLEQSSTGSNTIRFEANSSVLRGLFGSEDSDGGAILSGSSGYSMVLRSESDIFLATNGNNEALKIDTSQNATFAGSVGVGASPQSWPASNVTIEGVSAGLVLRDSTGSNQATQWGTLFTSNNNVRMMYDDGGTFQVGNADNYQGTNYEINLRIDVNSRISLSNNDSGTSNTIFGYLAGNAITSGDSNVAIGHQAMDEITTGDRNIAIGHDAIGNAQGGATSGGSKDNIAIGYQSQGGAWADVECLKNTSIGSYSLDGALNGALQNTAVGYASLGAVTQGDNNVAVGMEAGDNITTGTKNVTIGQQARTSAVGGTNQIVIGATATGVADNTAIIGNSSITDVYMGDNGNAWSQTSDGRLKENVVNWNRGLSEIEKLRIVEFNFKKDNPFNYDSKKKRQGIIAQEAKEIIPEMIKDDEEWLSANTEPMVWTLVKAVQELSARVKELESK